MSNSTTRISDLPENITLQMPTSAFPMNAVGSVGMGGDQGGLSNSYIPMNIHPNPYGNNTPDITLPFPQQQGQQGQQQYINQPFQDLLQHQQQQGQQFNTQQFQDMPQQRLPSRDIPINNLEYTNDQEIQPNFIPRAKLTSDYIKEYEDNEEKLFRKHEEKKYRKQMAEDLFTSLQTPILVAILFFIFQMAIVTRTMYKFLNLLPIYNTDGNLNIYGLIFKSTMFGSIFYSFDKIIHFLAYI